MQNTHSLFFLCGNVEMWICVLTFVKIANIKNSLNSKHSTILAYIKFIL